LQTGVDHCLGHLAPEAIGADLASRCLTTLAQEGQHAIRQLEYACASFASSAALTNTCRTDAVMCRIQAIAASMCGASISSLQIRQRQQHRQAVTALARGVPASN
jgi:hypothetical protein